eukprot:1160705-Pelagomonas_calceolata.AAC.20
MGQRRTVQCCCLCLACAARAAYAADGDGDAPYWVASRGQIECVGVDGAAGVVVRGGGHVPEY